MKNIKYIVSAFLIVLCTLNTTSAQINRTLETKVVDILAQLPTNDLNHTNKLMEDIIDLKTEGILQFCDMLVPPGTGNDTQARFAIHSLATYSGGKENIIKENDVEKALLLALQKESNIEIKTFLIERLAFCGSNVSLKELSTYLSHDKLYNVALGTIASIATTEAAQTIFKAAKSSKNSIKPSLISALGILNYKPAVEFINELAVSNNAVVQNEALMALAEIANPKSYNTLLNAAKKAEFVLDKSEAILAFIHYGNRSNKNGNINLCSAIGQEILKNCTSKNQLHFRSAGIHMLRENGEVSFFKTLLKEAKHNSKIYRGTVLDAASKNITSAEVKKWVKLYKKMSPQAKTQLLKLLQYRNEPAIFEKCILPAVSDKNETVRISGIKSLAFQVKDIALPVLLQSLKQATTSNEYKAIKETILRVCSIEDSAFLSEILNDVNADGKKVLVEVFAAKGDKKQFNSVFQLLQIENKNLKIAIFEAFPRLASSENLSDILSLLGTTKDERNIKNIQQAIISTLENSEGDHSKLIFNFYDSIQNKALLLPVLSILNNEKSLDLVTKFLGSTHKNEKKEALNALANWKNNDALPYLFKAVSNLNDTKLKSEAFKIYLSQVSKSSYPADQKLLLIRKLMPFSKSIAETKMIIRKAGSIKTFLSLIFVSEFLNSEEFKSTASNSAIKLALPTPGKKNGLSGDVVRQIILKSVDNLTGPDSQYIKIDVKEFLDNMSKEKGFISIFNGEDFSGWEGLVQNPISRGKMSKRTLEKAQAQANEKMLRDWFIKDGVIGFRGEGYNNICTIKDYGDFEMLVDWKITNGGDSGIYLRGTPQVQIWDIARTNVGAEVGSGGLYNNQKNERIPLVVADNPVNDWNTFRIKMVGERVTVYLNGVLVTDNVALENYWDRKSSIFSKEAIELQAHGEDLGFRNIYVREIVSGDYLLSDEEQKAGFKSLFNGKDLDHWIGNKTDYIVENNELAVRPKQGGHGNLYTAEEYSDFNFRFEFKLTPGANNGLGIHTPLEGDAAYVGKELQILDNTAAIYANLKPYQYHGSVYGLIAAKRGHLKPVGEWNSEEVIVKGDDIKIILNGVVIVDGNVKEASKNGTKDGKDHPGLKRNSGHIGFLGHGSELQFRNIRIKDLSL